MKSKLTRQFLTALTITDLILGVAAMALAAGAQNATNPSTTPTKAITADPKASPTIAPPDAQWIDPKWSDPGLVLPEFSVDLSLPDVANKLRHTFKDAFDVVIPGGFDYQNSGVVPSPVKPSEVSIKLNLKNVTVTEIFNAMNLVFEADNTPLRWELKVNGTRPLALLKVEPSLLPKPWEALGATGPPAEEKKRMVFFVGDLVGDGKSGSMTMDQLYQTVCQVYDMAYDNAAGTSPVPGPNMHGPSLIDLKFHKEAQLLIVNGSADKIDFVRNTLAALEGKQRLSQRTAGDAKASPEASKQAQAAPESNK